MPSVELLLRGFNMFCEECSVGLSTVCLVRGEHTYLVDTGHGGHRRQILRALAACGIAPEGVDFVILTHLHWDHIHNVDFFPGATLIVHEDEMRVPGPGAQPDVARPGYVASILEGYRVQTVRGDTELEPGLRLMEAPGHSAGHMAVLVDTPEGTAAICADALPDLWCAIHRHHYFAFYDPAAADESIKRILARATLIYPGHDRPFRMDGNGAWTFLSEAHSLRLWTFFEQSAPRVAIATSTAPDGTQNLECGR